MTKNNIFTVKIDVPYCLLPELLQYKELDITYKKIEDFTLQEVLDNPFIPVRDINDEDIKYHYQYTINSITNNYTELLNFQVNKQLANQLLIPLTYTTCIISSTQWDNFFSTECPKYCLFSEQIPKEFKSKKELLNYVYSVESEEFKHQYDDLTESEWQSINKTNTYVELQRIAETIYDLYQEKQINNKIKSKTTLRQHP